MRVLFVAPLSVEAATARYRCTHFAEALRLAGHEADVVSALDNTVTVNHDVVVLHRLLWNGPGRRFHEAARAVGATVLYGVDDLIFSPEYAYHVGILHPDDPPRYRYHRGEVNENRATLLAADGVLVSTEFLAAQVRQVMGNENKGNKPVWVLRNFPGAATVQLSETAGREARSLRSVRQDDRVTLGYLSGSPTHDTDLADLAAPLAGLLRRHPEVRLLLVGSVGIPETLAPFAAEGRLRRHPPVPWRDLPGLIATLDINLAPLDPTRAFAHAKSEVKWLEAAAVEVPTIAGWAAGFAEGVRDGEDCLLARTATEWEDALEKLVSDRERRVDLGNAAFHALTARATTAVQTERVAEVFMQAAGLRSASAPTKSVVVRRGSRERFVARLKAAEAENLRTVLRWARHRRLLRAEVET